MKIVVCMKQVPDTTEVKLDPKTGRLIRDGVPSIMNHDDKNALEAALSWKDQDPSVEIVALTMGPPQAETILREALAMGADSAILLTDRAFGGSDTWATSFIIAQAIRKIGNADIIFCGRQAIDGDTAQVGPQIAEKLGIPQVTYVKKATLENGKLICQRALEDGYQVIEVETPCLLTAVKELNTPRYPTVSGINDAYDGKEITVWTIAELPMDTEKIGLKGSPTNVFKTFSPTPKGAGTMLEGSDASTVSALFDALRDKNIL